MRDPLARKLFQSRDAREKLRGMGGIMASSPRLAETVAKFNLGGDVTVPIVGQTPFDIISTRVPGMSQPEMIEAGLPRAGLPRREIVEIMERVDPNIGPEEFAAMSREERLAAGFSRLGALNDAYFAARDRLLESQFPEQGPPSPPEPTLPRTPLSARLPFGDREIEAVDEFAFDMLPPSQAPAPISADPAAGEDEMSRLAREDAARIAEQRGAAGVTDARESFGARITAGDEEGAAEIIERAREVVRAEVSPPPSRDPEDDGGDNRSRAVLDGAPDFDTTYEQMLARLQGVMGTEDKDKREKAMANLAMIGLAIAAGQSPNALTNIAQGALVGMQGIQQAEAAERAQEQEMRLAALKMAQEEVTLNRRLQSAEQIAAMRAGSDAESQRQEYLYNDVFRQMLEQARQETDDDTVAVNRAASAAAQAAPNAPSAVRWRMSQGQAGGGGSSVELLTPEERELLGL